MAPTTASWSTNVPEFPCKDCQVNTCPLEGEREYYEVTDAVWHKAGATGFGQTDNGPSGYFLCVGCLETRLKRKLTRADFKPYPANTTSPWLTTRLNTRLVGAALPFFIVGTKETTPHFYPNALTEAVLRRFKPAQYYTSPTGSYAINDTSINRGENAINA